MKQFYMECWDDGKTLLSFDLADVNSVQSVETDDGYELTLKTVDFDVTMEYTGEEAERGFRNNFNKIRKELRKFHNSVGNEEDTPEVEVPAPKKKVAKPKAKKK